MFVKDLNLDAEQRIMLLALAGLRYRPATDELVINSVRLPNREANKLLLQNQFVALLHAAKTTPLPAGTSPLLLISDASKTAAVQASTLKGYFNGRKGAPSHKWRQY